MHDFLELIQEIDLIVESYRNKSIVFASTRKSDGSMVTDFDLLLSDRMKAYFQKHFPNHNFFSEEDYNELTFPAIIVDPLDGTNGFIEKSYECCVSIAIMNTPDIKDPSNQAFIYDLFQKKPVFPTDAILVSKNEWKKGLHIQSSKNLNFFPFGSIAFKLKLIADNMGEAVISRQPKAIWDIAAGTILTYRQGIRFTANGQELTQLDQIYYEPNLVWARDDFREKNQEIL